MRWWRLIGASPLLLGALWLQWWWGATGLAIGLLFPAAFVCARRRWLERGLLVVGAPYLALFGWLVGVGSGGYVRYELERYAGYEPEVKPHVLGMRVDVYVPIAVPPATSSQVLPGLTVSGEIERQRFGLQVALSGRGELPKAMRIARAELQHSDGHVAEVLDMSREIRWSDPSRVQPQGWIPFQHTYRTGVGPQPVSEPRAMAGQLDPFFPLAANRVALALTFELDHGESVSTHELVIPLRRVVYRQSGIWIAVP